MGTRPANTLIPAKLAVPIGLAVLAALSFPAAAKAGNFTVLMCSNTPGPGVGPVQFSKAGPEGKFVIDQLCQEGGAMRVADNPSNAQSAREQGAWQIGSANRAPAHLLPLELSFQASGKADRGLRPFVEGKLRNGRWRRLAGAGTLPGGQFKAFHFPGAFEAMRLRLSCERQGGCGAESAAHVRVRKVRFTVFEGAQPVTPRFSGALVQHAAQRGFQSVGASTADGQAGIHSTTLQVNGTQYTTLKGSCADGGRDASGRVSLGRWRPCDNAVSTATINTNDGTLPFREGLNRIRLCAADFAGNSRCSRWRMIRVNNRCPIRPAGDTAVAPARLAATFGNRRRLVRGRYPRRSVVHARLLDAAGQPLATSGASICVTQKVSLSRLRRASVALPNFPSGGKMRLPSGPNRVVWVNYWLDAERVLTTRLRVKTRPRIGLSRRGAGTLRNGETMRLRAKLRGPFKRGRKVVFRVRTGGRSFRLGADRTNSNGVAQLRHTFRDIRSPSTIRVRARVSRQRGYPFLGGRSDRRKVRLAP